MKTKVFESYSFEKQAVLFLEQISVRLSQSMARISIPLQHRVEDIDTSEDSMQCTPSDHQNTPYSDTSE
jgi:hypothetical protein